MTNRGQLDHEKWARSRSSFHAPSTPTLADGGDGIGVHTPIKQPADGRRLDLDNRTYNALLRGLRALGERGFTILTGRWRTLHRITASPRKIGTIVKAALVLTLFEHKRIT